MISKGSGWQAKAPCLEGGLLAGICAVVLQACQLGCCCHNGVDEVGLIVVGHPLQDLHTGGVWLSLQTTACSKPSGACLAAKENRLQRIMTCKSEV